MLNVCSTYLSYVVKVNREAEPRVMLSGHCTCNLLHCFLSSLVLQQSVGGRSLLIIHYEPIDEIFTLCAQSAHKG